MGNRPSVRKDTPLGWCVVSLPGDRGFRRGTHDRREDPGGVPVRKGPVPE